MFWAHSSMPRATLYGFSFSRTRVSEAFITVYPTAIPARKSPFLLPPAVASQDGNRTFEIPAGTCGSSSFSRARCYRLAGLRVARGTLSVSPRRDSLRTTGSSCWFQTHNGRSRWSPSRPRPVRQRVRIQTAQPLRSPGNWTCAQTPRRSSPAPSAFRASVPRSVLTRPAERPAATAFPSTSRSVSRVCMDHRGQPFRRRATHRRVPGDFSGVVASASTTLRPTPSVTLLTEARSSFN